MSDDIYNQQSNFVQILKGLINSLPSTYNKETNDTNYYRLLRSLALELSNAEIEVQRLKDDKYLDTVSPASIYNNFGTLVKLNKDATWDDEKYRRLIQGVMQSLLAGPTKKSLTDGLKLFTNFNVNVYELYKDADSLDHYIFDGIDVQFAFVLEIEKPLENFADQNALMKDAQYLVNIIKPAHTISLIITTLFSDVNYKTWFSSKYQKNYYENIAKQFIVDYTNSYIKEIKKIDVNAIIPPAPISRNVVDYHDYINTLDDDYKSIRESSYLKNITLPDITKLKDLTQLETYSANITYFDSATKQRPNVTGYYNLLNSSDYLRQQAANDFDLDFDDFGALYSEYIRNLRYQYSILTSSNLQILPVLPAAFDFTSVTDYYGMDEIDFVNIPEGTPIDDQLYDQKNHAQIRYKDNIFPYRYKGPGVFTTNQSKIGGIDYIAPQYMVKDNDFIDIEFFYYDVTLPLAEEFGGAELEYDDKHDIVKLVAEHYEPFLEIDIDAPKANDHDNFLLETSTFFEDYYDFVGGGGATFQLFRNNMGSTISGHSILGSYYADLIIEVGYDFNETFNTVFDHNTIDIEELIELYDVQVRVVDGLTIDVDSDDIYSFAIIDHSEEIEYLFKDDYDVQILVSDIMPDIESESNETYAAVTDYMEHPYLEINEPFNVTIEVLEESLTEYTAPIDEDTLDWSSAKDNIIAMESGESDIIKPVVELLDMGGYAQDVYDRPITDVEGGSDAEFVPDEYPEFIYTIVDVYDIVINEFTDDASITSSTTDQHLADHSINNQEISTMVSMEGLQRLTLGKTPLNSSRLGGIVRDQVTMVAG